MPSLAKPFEVADLISQVRGLSQKEMRKPGQRRKACRRAGAGNIAVICPEVCLELSLQVLASSLQSTFRCAGTSASVLPAWPPPGSAFSRIRM